MHREVWHPSKVTLEAYRRLRAAQGYDPRLDLVAVAPDGGFGSYCICWFDPHSRTGLFEPVGTRPASRGRGLGKAVMYEGLRRLRELGARTALVLAVHDNEAARRLYESVGFKKVNAERLYGRKPRV
jgi:GNAT superfamily N-acetyltransferase